MEFLQELACKYKERGRFPFIPIRELALSYEDKQDSEVAAFAGLLVKDDNRMERNVREIRAMLGSNPWEWFESRQFIMLATGDRGLWLTGGIRNWRLARLFDNMHIYGYPFTNVLSSLDADEYQKRLIRLIFGLSDGFGVGGWHISSRELKCPDTVAVKKFLRLWLPEYGNSGKYFTFDEAVGLFGFEMDYDFFYAFLGWEELCRRNPIACRRYVSVYQKRYRECNIFGRKYWYGKRLGIIPEIDFE